MRGRAIIKDQSGVLHVLPLLLIVVAIGIISFLVISSTAPAGGLFSQLNPKSVSHAATLPTNSYTTNFPATENPISEGGVWLNGKTDGLDWTDVQTVSGKVFGNVSPSQPPFEDPTAVLKGTWGPDQQAQGTVFCSKPDDTQYQEVELRLRSKISAHSITGYEIFSRCLKTGFGYFQVVRWDGPVGKFTPLLEEDGAQFGVQTGDVFKATIVGNVITGYINGVQVGQVTDNTFTTGSPGVGFDFGVGTTNTDFGFTNFTAQTIGSSTPSPTSHPTTTPIPSPSATLAPTPSPGTNSFTGEYWNAGSGSSPAMPTTAPNLIRNDPSINFNYGNGSPDPKINADHFIARWTGNFTFTAGSYSFSTTADDGVRLYVDGNLIIDHWIDEAPTTYTSTQTLTAGTHAIKMEYYENSQGAVAQLTWGKPWANVTNNLSGLSSTCGNLGLVSAMPNASTVIAGVNGNGLYSSSNGGVSWTKMGQGSGSDAINNRMAWIVYDPANASTFWEVGNYGNGVYVTRDGGNTFKQLGSVSHLDYLSVDFSDPQRKTLVAGGHEQGQSVWKSTDGGQTWTNIGASLPAGTGFSNGPIVINSQTFIANTNPSWAGGSPGIYRSTDGGATWQLVSSSGPYPPALLTSGAIYYPNGGNLMKSTDQGITWTGVGSGLAGSAPIQLPDGRLVAAGSSTLLISSDGGSTWNPIGSPFPYAPSGIAYSVGAKAFFIWHNDCGNLVLSDAVMKLDYDFGFPVTTPTPSASSTTLQGDLDGDNHVTIFDYNILVGNFNKTGTGIQGDIDGNGKVDIFDYNILVGNFGK